MLFNTLNLGIILVSMWNLYNLIRLEEDINFEKALFLLVATFLKKDFKTLGFVDCLGFSP